jgi:membrane protein DedA with SNARE-associated domain
MSFIFTHIAGWFIQFRYIAIFIAVVIEGPIITVISGSFCSLGILNLFYTYPIVVFADLTGDCIYYLIGRFSGDRFINHYGRYIGINPEQLPKIKDHFDSRGASTLFLGKIAHGIGGFFLFAAGSAKMSFPKFFLYNFLATIVKSLILLLLGYFFGQAILKINSLLQLIAIIFAGLLVIVILIYLYSKRKNK